MSSRQGGANERKHVPAVGTCAPKPAASLDDYILDKPAEPCPVCGEPTLARSIAEDYVRLRTRAPSLEEVDFEQHEFHVLSPSMRKIVRPEWDPARVPGQADHLYDYAQDATEEREAIAYEDLCREYCE